MTNPKSVYCDLCGNHESESDDALGIFYVVGDYSVVYCRDCFVAGKTRYLDQIYRLSYLAAENAIQANLGQINITIGKLKRQ